ncbi:hypothetical protein JCM3774_002675 [Rhodotorula dairenensis]
MENDTERDAVPPDAFPDLSPLAVSLGDETAVVTEPTRAAAAATSQDTDDVSGIWATVPTQQPDLEQAPPGVSADGYHAAYLKKTPPPATTHVNTAVDLHDLDPFAPVQGTLGSTVRRESRLEVIADSESDKDAPTDIPPDQTGGTQAQRDHLGHGADPPAAAGFSFGSMLRSLSGTPTRDRPSSPTSLRPPPHPVVGTPEPATASTSAASHTTPASSPAQPGPSGLAKPLASIASVFRSSARPSPTASGEGTPQPGNSPPREKGGFLTAIAGVAASGKGKERERESEKFDDGDEKRAEGVVAEKGRRRDKPDEPVFDFNRFLEQMRSRSADPIAKYLRSFLKEFSRRPPVSTTDQVRVINDFLDFIAGKMRQVDPWKSLLDVDWRDDPERAEAEFDLALEAMEKLVMNRLWHLTFSPAIDLSAFPDNMSPSGDVERDDVLRQRIRFFSWIEPKHLDLPIPSPSDASAAPTPQQSSPRLEPKERPPSTDPIAAASSKETEPPKPVPAPAPGKGSRKQVQSFLNFAQSELCKMNQYKAPRDKLICVLNCCKVIFGLMRHVASGEEGADTFIPFLIYVVIRANPEHLVSNLQYIQRFRNPEKLSGEGGYYLSSLTAAISFIESMDASSLSNITQAEFEARVADAVKKIASEEPPPPVPVRDEGVRPPPRDATATSTDLLQPTEAGSASLLSASGGVGRSGQEGDVASAIPQNVSFPQSVKDSLLRGTENVERAMSKPLGALARIFEQLEETANEITGQSTPAPTSPTSRSLRIPPAPFPPTPGVEDAPDGYPGAQSRPSMSKRRSHHQAGGPLSRPPLLPLPSSTGSLQHAGPPPDPAMYAAPETSDDAVLEEIDRQHEEARQAQLETLQSIFPEAEREVIEMVLLSNSGDMGKTIDSMLEMS